MLSDLEVVDDVSTGIEDQRRDCVIKVVGVGGGGNNAVNRMIESGISGVDFIAANTDSQALTRTLAPQKILLGRHVTRGLGAGGKPDVGAAAAEEEKELIKTHLAGADMVFITAGMGGGTGTGAAPVVAKIAKEMGILTVAVVTKPFSYEGRRKENLAVEGIEKLSKAVDTLITIPNDKLLSSMGSHMVIRASFLKADEILQMGVKGISEIITQHGEINIDFADVRTVMEGKGEALMGIGHGSGDNRAVDAVTAAIQNPLLDDVSIDGAQGLLVNITGGSDFSMDEMQEIMSIATQNLHPDAIIIYGLVVKPELKDEVYVTVIATGFTPKDTQTAADYSKAKSAEEKIPTAKAPKAPAAGNSEIIGFNELESFLKGPAKAANHGQLFLGPRSEDENINIPAYYRKNPLGKNDGAAR